MKYVCTKGFSFDKHDDDGFFTGEVINVEQGDEFDLSDSEFRTVGGKDSIRLENDNLWLELTREMLDSHFEEVHDGR
jgi:hypothetical protein